eukprot:3879667-Rhodomonas_salina.3
MASDEGGWAVRAESGGRCWCRWRTCSTTTLPPTPSPATSTGLPTVRATRHRDSGCCCEEACTRPSCRHGVQSMLRSGSGVSCARRPVRQCVQQGATHSQRR